jgi:hypothetical protein
MGFFDYWFKKPEPEQPESGEPSLEDFLNGGTPIVVPMSQLLRNVIYDAGFAHPEAVIHALGLQGISPDVEEMEQAASEERLASIEPLGPFLSVMSSLLAQATVAYSTSEMDEDMSEELREALSQQFQRLALGSSVSTIASLVDLGLLHVGGAAIGMGSSMSELPTEFLDRWGGKEDTE